MALEKEPGAEEFGCRLRARREELGMSRRDVAHASGLSYPYVSQLETGYRLPSHKSVAMLAAALELEPSELSAVIPYPDLATGQSLPPAAARRDPRRASSAWRPNPVYQDSTPPGQTRSSAPKRVVAQIAELLSALPREERLEALSQAQRQVLERFIAEEVDESR